MQDIHSFGGGPLFGGGDRRLRPNHHHQNHQALKCPRCESPNTKFCYFNNYNLSQPRHFCKSCRRYWTKGGVLRNVPVGGGCRKSKRSKSKSKSSSSENRRKSNSHSSSESSSLSANTTAATTASTTTAATTEAVSASSSNTAYTLLNSQDSRFFLPSTTNPSFDPPLIDQSSGGGIFPDIGNLTSLITTYSEQSLLGFNASDMSYRLHQDSHGPFSRNQSSPNQAWEQQQKMVCSGVNDELKFPEISAGFLDQTATIGLSGLQSRTSNDGVSALDWRGGGGDQGLFDLTGNVDQGYWSQTQWVDNDQSLNYLP